MANNGIFGNQVLRTELVEMGGQNDDRAIQGSTLTKEFKAGNQQREPVDVFRALE